MQIENGLHLIEDTCNVYALVQERQAVLIDFGSGRALDQLAELGVDRITDVLITHHHRDQVQGLARAIEHGAQIWVPPTERDLIERVDRHWQARVLTNNYDLRQDRFSLLEPVPVTGGVAEYRSRTYGHAEITALPTPGHTLGSETYLVRWNGRTVAFTGDLIYGPGQVWSTSALQWSYSGMEGAYGTALSLRELAEHDPDLLLPAHGGPITDPAPAMRLLEQRMVEMVDMRRDEPWDLDDRYARPFRVVRPHLLQNRTSFSNAYVLLSETGNALLIDYGYDNIAGLPIGEDRSSRRPLLSCLRSLRRDFGVKRIEVALPTHYHEDHVAGFNLMREVEGTEVWAAETVAPLLTDPLRYDMPCLYYDPIPVDRVLPLGEPFRWHEYELAMHPLPGHTLYAVAIVVEVDGTRVIATGDQQDTNWSPDGRSETLNLQYRNRFAIDDFVASAELYRSLRPDLIVSGHWAPREVDDAYLDMLLQKGKQLARLHRDLLPLSDVDFGAEGFGARIYPYQATFDPGQELAVQVEALNPFDRDDVVAVGLVVPAGWSVTPDVQVKAGPKETVTVEFRVTAPDSGPVVRARVGADLIVGGRPFGQQAEALFDVR
ncbi:MAG TPA: MBL fold metallo-hydrolase [Mycobacteriales bacterium]|nr:MBL fold metallo-hydrolase [Mycobacteriales bacterium]